MAWKQIKTRILGKNIKRAGSLSKRMLFTWCMLASIIFYLIPQNSSNKLQLAFAHVFRIPLSAGRKISLSTGTQRNLKDTVSRKEYETLRNDYFNLTEKYNQQIKDFKYLMELNSFVGQNVDYILGYIIPAAADQQHSELAIHCGGVKGLEIGRFVMARNFTIIGTISYIEPKMEKAKVRLITDPESNIAVRIEGLDQKLWMQGKGDNTAIIRNVEEKITPGQKVFAIRQAGFTDSDRYLGTVSKCIPDDKNRLLQEIIVKPAWNIRELNEVAVIIKKQPK